MSHYVLMDLWVTEIISNREFLYFFFFFFLH